MSEHINQWLSAYLDGELSGHLLYQVETHLKECQACFQEYRSLQELSVILQGAPLPEPISTTRFASQVALRLPHRRVPHIRNKVLEVGWWLVPVGLMTVWIFIQITFTLSDWISTASIFGFVSDATLSISPEAARFTSMLGEFGLLSGNSLEWATWSESITRTVFSQITWQVSIAMLYLSWIVTWWAHQKREEIGQSFKARNHPAVED